MRCSTSTGPCRGRSWRKGSTKLANACKIEIEIYSPSTVGAKITLTTVSHRDSERGTLLNTTLRKGEICGTLCSTYN